MATEFSFTKRAAAELSRCFNVGLNVSNKNATSSPSSAKKPTAASSTANGIAPSNNQSTNQMTGNESNTKTDEPIRNNLAAGDPSTGKSANNNVINSTNASNSIVNSNDSTGSKANNPTSSAASNLFTLTNSVKSIGSAYEQNILAAKSALRSPFKSPNKSAAAAAAASTKSIVSNVVSSFNGFDSSNSNSDPNHKPLSSSSVFSSSPQTPRKQAPKAPPKTNRARLRNYLLSLNNQKPQSVEELWKDDKFLKLLFQHFSPIERCKLAQVSCPVRLVLFGNQTLVPN